MKSTFDNTAERSTDGTIHGAARTEVNRAQQTKEASDIQGFVNPNISNAGTVNHRSRVVHSATLTLRRT